MPREGSLIAKNIIDRGRAHSNQSRLQFPLIMQQKKHFYLESVVNEAKINCQKQMSGKFKKGGNLDISDIEGAKPKPATRSRSTRHVTPSHYQEQLDLLISNSASKPRDMNNRIFTNKTLLQKPRNNPQLKVQRENTMFMRQQQREHIDYGQYYRKLKTQPVQEFSSQDFIPIFKQKEKIITNKNTQKSNVYQQSFPHLNSQPNQNISSS